MEELNRVIVLKLEVEEGKIVAIHALEIIDDIITGIFFHAFLNKNIQKYNDMYYLARYKHFDENYLQNFIHFVRNSKLITCNGEYELIKDYFPNNITENFKLNNDLFREARKNKININSKSRRGGLIDCIIFARLLYDKHLNKNKMIKMTGVFSKRKYYKDKEEEKEKEEELSEEEDDDDNNIIDDHNIFSFGRFIVIDTDTTSFKRKNCRLVAIHAVEVKDGKLTGIFFHTFINKRDYNYDFMYYFAEYNYCLDKKEKLQKFLKFIDNSILVGHNIKYDIRYINKELNKHKLPKISKNKCICTMHILKNLRSHTLKDCAKFFGINGIYDYHKGIVDTTILAIIVCKMAESDDINYSIENEEIPNYQINKNSKVYVFLKGKKFHLYSSCGNLFWSDRITVTKAEKIGKKLCQSCVRKRQKEIKYYY